MKTLITTAAIMLALSPAAWAQTASTATSSTNSAATSAAQNAGNAQLITFNSEATDRMKTTPQVGGQGFYGSFSPDSCAVSAGGGAAFNWFGLNLAVPVNVTSCIALRGFERTMQAAATFQAIGDHMTAARLRQGGIDMLCQVSDEVAQALAYQGLCSDFKKEYNVPAPMPVILAAPSVPETIHMRINQDGTITRQ